MKTLIGIVSYGGLDFLKLAVRAIQETLTRSADVCVVVAQPGDGEMAAWVAGQGCQSILHTENLGFPASINDLSDLAWKHGGYDNLICMGNDVVPMPGALDAMIDCAEQGAWDIVCASEFDARYLVNTYPAARPFFHGDNLAFTDFSARPWELHWRPDRPPSEGREPDTYKDVRNLTLYRRGAFDQLGYDDVNFWPNGYYADNDYCRRAVLAGVSAGGLRAAEFFHFWSRTIHQGESRAHGKHFNDNATYYRAKWGGLWGEEKWTVPFDGRKWRGAPGFALKISTRDHERACIDYWKER